MAFEYLRYVAGGIDRNAVLHELITVLGKDVWDYAFFLTLRPEVADDITQEVFLKVYEKLNGFRGESTMRTWLLAITRNKVRDHWKSSWIKRVTLVDRLFPASHQPSAENEVLGKLAEDEVWEQVLKLPPKLREVLLLYTRHRMSMSDIAHVMGITEGTVKSRLHRARLKVDSELRGSGRIDG